MRQQLLPGLSARLATANCSCKILLVSYLGGKPKRHCCTPADRPCTQFRGNLSWPRSNPPSNVIARLKYMASSNQRRALPRSLLIATSSSHHSDALESPRSCAFYLDSIAFQAAPQFPGAPRLHQRLARLPFPWGTQAFLISAARPTLPVLASKPFLISSVQRRRGVISHSQAAIRGSVSSWRREFRRGKRRSRLAMLDFRLRHASSQLFIAWSSRSYRLHYFLSAE